MVLAWYAGLASFSNCEHRNQPCFAHSSSALATIPVPLPALGVTMTFAPSMRMIFRRSTLKGSAMQITQSYPLCAHTIATAMPVFPLVASTTVSPFFRTPRRSASVITARARLFFWGEEGTGGIARRVQWVGLRMYLVRYFGRLRWVWYKKYVIGISLKKYRAKKRVRG